MRGCPHHRLQRAGDAPATAPTPVVTGRGRRGDAAWTWALSTLAMAVRPRTKKEWPDLGIMLVAEVHFRNSLAGFQFLTVANISMHKPMDSDTTIGTLRAMAADIVKIIAERHVQVLAGDFGCALFALAALIRGSGVQLHVAALRSGTDNVDDQPFLDSCAVFIVGPVSEVKSLLPIGDTTLPAALRSGSSVRIPWYIRVAPLPATGKALIDTLLDSHGDGSITAGWQTMPRSREKRARTFTHNDDTINAVVVPLIIFVGTHPRRKPASQWRRNALAAQRKGNALAAPRKGKGKGKGKGKDKGMAKGKGRAVDQADL